MRFVSSEVAAWIESPRPVTSGDVGSLGGSDGTWWLKNGRALKISGKSTWKGDLKSDKCVFHLSTDMGQQGAK